MLCRKPVKELGVATVRDAEGFDDLEEFFSQEVENNAGNTKQAIPELQSQPLKQSPIRVEEAAKPQQSADYVAEPNQHDYEMDYTVPVNYGSDGHGMDMDIPQHNDSNNYNENDYQLAEGTMDVDQADAEVEIEFSPKITLRKSLSRSQPPVTKQQESVKKTEKKRAPVIKKKPQQKRPLVVKSSASNYTASGFRHSSRRRIQPLEFWRGETLKYGRSEDLNIPVVIDVVRKEKPVAPPKPAKRTPKGKKSGKTSSSRTVAVERALEKAGFVPKINVTATVMDYDNECETERLIAISEDQHRPEAVHQEKFKISTVFEEGSFLTAGILIFPPGVEKPNRNSAKHALVFYVISGTFQVTINNTTFVIGTGGQFIVPRGNHYQIKSVYDKEGKLHFCHCKDTASS